MTTILSYSFSLIALIFSSMPTTGTLTVQIENVEQQKGSLAIAVFEQTENFLDADYAVQKVMQKVSATGTNNVQLADLPFGTYSVAVYHDVNGNGKLDTNFLGVPKEPYGFSGGFSSKWSKPTFEETQFDFQEPKTIRIALKVWSEQ